MVLVVEGIAMVWAKYSSFKYLDSLGMSAVEARKLEYDCSSTPKLREAGKPA